MEAFVVALQSVWNDSGFSAFTMGHAIMMLGRYYSFVFGYW